MKGRTKLICCILSLCMLMSSVSLSVSAGWDGYVTTKEDSSFTLVSMNSFSTIAKAGAAPDHTKKKTSGYTARWDNQTVNRTVDFEGIRRDWSDYTTLEFWCYSQKATNAQIQVVVDCTQMQTDGIAYFANILTVDWEGWKKVSIPLETLGGARGAKWSMVEGLRFTNAWGTLKADPNTALWFDDLLLKSQSTSVGGSVATNYSFDEVSLYEELIPNAYTIHDGTEQMLSKNEPVVLNAPSVYQDGTLYCSPEFFAKLDGVTVNTASDNITLKNNTANIVVTVDGACTVNGEAAELYGTPFKGEKAIMLPAAHLATLLGFEVVADEKLVIVGTGIDEFANNKNLRKIAAYLTCFKEVDVAKLTADDYKLLKDNWRRDLVGFGTPDMNNETIKAKVEAINQAAQIKLDALNTTDPTKPLWGTAMQTTANLTTQYEGIRTMALAYATPGTALYQNAELLEKILYALDWGYENIYGKAEMANKGWRDTSLHDWYDWQIATPRALVDTLILLEDEVGQQRIKNYIEVLKHFVRRVNDYGSNRLYFAKIIIGYSALGNDGAKILEAIYGSDETIAEVEGPTAQGFHEDGTYIYHTRHFMNGAYGLDQFELVAYLMKVLEGTAFELSNPDRENIIEWAHSSFVPISYKGALMMMTQGRGATNGVSAGHRTFKVYLDLLDLAKPEQLPELKELIKRTANELGLDTVYAKLSLNDILKLQEVMADTTVSGDSAYEQSKVYSEGDRAVHHKEGFTAGIAMSSSRVFNYESINSENMEGWYMGDGMLYVYTDENTQYDSSWYMAVNKYRMPGTTVDTQERKVAAIKQGNEYLSSKDFVGGATLDDKYLTAAMDLESFHNEVAGYVTDTGNGADQPLHDCSLTAKKSWFMFDDEIVALGADVTANDGFNVHTIVDNRKSENNVLVSKAEVSPYPIASLEASIVEQPENPPEHTIDDKQYTRWSAQGDVWIKYDLGEVKDLGYVVMSFYSGSARVTYFDIEVSEDGNTWQQVFDGGSSGTTSGFEIFPIGSVKARYIRVNGHGNSASAWNSISEFKAYPPTASGKLVIEDDTYIGSDTLLVNGVDTQITDGEDKLYENTSYAHLDKFGGYYFPNKENLSVRRTLGTTSYSEMWIDHGVSPQASDYAYVLLPGMTADETKSYSSNPQVEILSNTGALQAVHSKSTGVYAMVFWQKGSIAGVTVDSPLIVMMQKEDGKIKMTASDPTHKLTTAKITIDKEIAKLTGSESVASADGKTITLNLEGSKGKTFAFECEVK